MRHDDVAARVTAVVKGALGYDALNDMQLAMAAAKGHQVLLLAPTGSGKTAAFVIAMLVRLGLDAPVDDQTAGGIQSAVGKQPVARKQSPGGNQTTGRRSPVAVVLAPSRELVLQIHGVLKSVLNSVGNNVDKNVDKSVGKSVGKSVTKSVDRSVAGEWRTAALYGGHRMADEEATLTVMPHIVVATPGRLLDHLQRGNLSLQCCRVAVLDEYDKILELGFEGEMRRIMRRMTALQDIIMTSATRMENGEWRMENGERGTGKEERGTRGGERGTGNGELGAGNIPVVTLHAATTSPRLLNDIHDSKSLKNLKEIIENNGLKGFNLFDESGDDGLPAGRWEVLDFLPGDSHGERVEVVEVPSASRDKLQSLIDLLLSGATGGRTMVFVNHRESAQRVYDALHKAHIDAALYHGGLDQRERELAVAKLRNGSTAVLVSTDLGARGLDIDALDSVVHYHMPTSPQAWKHRNGRTGRQGAGGTVYVITSEADDRPDYFAPCRTLVPRPRPQTAAGTGNWEPGIGAEERETRSEGRGTGNRERGTGNRELGIFSIPAPASATAPAMVTLYFDAGRREKISRGDIAGFLIKVGGLEPGQVGMIEVHDHDALAAVDRSAARQALGRLKGQRLKGKRVRVSII